MDIMREVNWPMPVRAIAVRTLAVKGCTLPDRRLVKRTRALVSKRWPRGPSARAGAHSGAEEQHMTNVGEIVGTACYWAPL